MRGLDLFIERQQLNDRSNDVSSLAFSREANELKLQTELESKQQSAKDKVSFATASMAFGNPFMLLGLGVALLDEFGMVRAERRLNDLRNAKNRPLHTLRKSLPLIESDKKLKPFEQPALSTSILALEWSEKKTGKKSKRRTKDQVMFSDARKTSRPFLNRKGWLEASRLVKKKQFLLNQVERLNNGSNSTKVTNLMAKIELLDKALKQMGC